MHAWFGAFSEARSDELRTPETPPRNPKLSFLTLDGGCLTWVRREDAAGGEDKVLDRFAVFPTQG